MVHPTTLDDLATPAFVVNRHAFRRNCESARTAGISLRPHVKTHKTKEGCLIQAGMGSGGGESGASTSEVIGFVASTLPELYMVVDLACEHQCRPFTDVLLGVPICKTKLEAILKLKRKLKSAINDGTIHVMIDNPGQVDFLEDFIRKSTSEDEGGQWSVFLKLDTGYHRAGVKCNGEGVSLATKIIESRYLSLKGVYSHCGHSYDINDLAEMEKVVQDDHSSIAGFVVLLSDYLNENKIGFDISSLDISVGSTPSMFTHKGCTSDHILADKLELHPGNYVFYDRQQLYTGACASERSVAGFVLTRVIGHYKDERNAIMVDAGATALTKEATPQGDMCAVLGRPDLECYRMSQECTMIRRRDGSPFPFEEFPFGSTMLLLPNHSCLAAACFSTYHVVDEAISPFNTCANIVETWKPAQGWA